MKWILNLDGGPKRVNHAAVAIGEKIYMFGGYTASDVGHQNEFIDVHVLNTFTYRWERLPLLPYDAEWKKPKRSATISGPSPNEPSTSQSLHQQVNRRRAHSLDIHPLAEIRVSNPPLDDDDLLLSFEPFESPRPEPEENSEQRYATSFGGSAYLAPGMETGGMTGLAGRLASISDEDEEYAWTDVTESADEFMEADDEDEEMEEDEEEEEDDEEEEDPRVIVQVEGLGDVEVPMGMDLAELKKFQEHPEIPFKRYGHTVVAYKGHAYLWGGRNDTYGCRSTLHRYDPVCNRWSLLQTEGQCPPARDGHSAVVWADNMYIFGGYEEKEYRFSQETYVYNFPTATWTKLKTQGDPPQYRDFHASCVLDGKMYVFGGRSDETGQSHTSHDLYDDKFRYLDLGTQRWHLLSAKGKQHPCGRRSHTMWTYRGRIYMFGGFHSTRNVHFNDLWQFDPKTSEWTEVKPSGQAPCHRRRQCTVMVRDRLFLFGGTMPNPRKKISSNSLEDLGDLFVLDFAPSLVTLCQQAVLKHGLKKHAETVLPEFLTRELHYMSTPNQFSKPVHRIGTNMRG